MKNIQKTNEICYCLGGNSKLGGGGGGGGISPPKGPEKNTALSLQWPYQSKIAGSGPV